MDSNFNILDKDYQNSTKQFQRIVNSIKTFTNINECKTFFDQIKNEQFFLIVSGSVGEQLVPNIENLSHLNSTYTFCSNKSKHLLWAKNYRKIKDVFTTIDALCEILQSDIKQCEYRLVFYLKLII